MQCFIFIQSEGLACNRRKAYVISSLCELYVIKAYALYVFNIRIDYIPPAVDYIHGAAVITYRNKLRITCKVSPWFTGAFLIYYQWGESMKDNPLLKNAQQLAVSIESLCKTLERTGNSNTLFQIKKSSSSVFANITEAQYPQSLPDMLSKFKIARKEWVETESWLKLLYSNNSIDVETFKKNRNLCGRIQRTLTSSCITIENKINQK